MRTTTTICTLVLLAAGATACRKNGEGSGGHPGEDPGRPATGGIVRADGSSTVFPITEAVAEEFQKAKRGAKVTVGISGTGGGFKKFIAARSTSPTPRGPSTPTRSSAARRDGIEYIELPVAFDGLTVVVNPQNTWVEEA